ncbi:MAG: DUF3380 domain-containing protein [Acidobacteriaceae bacterium]|nr:DUF3380 domain-containing protein [Acidobacteriaceae bacterium]
MSIPFQGTAWALSAESIAAAADALAVSAAEIWTVLAVETSGCGYLADRRPQICFERHVFHRLTQGKYDDGDISDPTPGGYGAPGAHQYERLNLAIEKDRNAALKSASWGIGQIMGENFVLAGHKSVEDFVIAMMRSEDDQLAAMADFLFSRKLHFALQAHDWADFARHYNGPDFAVNQYALRLNIAYKKFSSGSLPDLNVRASQLYLTYLGFDPGPVDGVAGERTIFALAGYHRSQALEGRPLITSEFVEQLKDVLYSKTAANGLAVAEPTPA